MILSDGEVYIGAMKNGRSHGFGTLYKKNGLISKEGEWENGTF